MIHFFYVGLLVVVLFAYTYFIKTEPPAYEFFKFNAAQFFTPVLQSVVFIGLAYFINIKLSGKNKQNEILAEEIDEILKTLSELKVEVIEYFDVDKSITVNAEKIVIRKQEAAILGYIKDLANKIIFLNTLYSRLKYNDLLNSVDRLIEVRKLKQAVTAKHFKQKSYYSASEQWQIENLFRKLAEQYKTEKIALHEAK